MMKQFFFGMILTVLALFLTNGREVATAQTPTAKTFQALPTGSIRPDGWLLTQLQIQANGLTGHLDEFWPSLRDSKWRGDKKGEGWERGPYYLDGLVPLAFLLDDARLKAKIKPYIEYILTSGRPDGSFGPGTDTWPCSVAMKVLTQYYEATGDQRVITLMTNYFQFLDKTKPDWPRNNWRGVRAMELVVSAFWLYERTQNPLLLKVAANIQKESLDWRETFRNFQFAETPAEVIKKKMPGESNYTKALQKAGFYHETHVVNIAMAMKNAGLCYRLSGQDSDRKAAQLAIETMDKYHGQAGGRFSGDEHISGKKPTQGTELCAVVEYMFSLENLIEIFGDVAYSDRLELLAYNAQPGTWTPDCWAHQYDQQSNQVLVDISKRNWSNNTDTANIYGLEPHYGCCTSNMHQGWPKFVSHLWMATPEKGLAAVAYGPCRVKAKVADGTEIEIQEVTDYPFSETIRFNIQTSGKEVAFPLSLRIPLWADNAKISVNGKAFSPAADSCPFTVRSGKYSVIQRTWKSGDVVEMTLPMTVRTEYRYNNAVSLYRGPLLYSLRIGEKFEQIRQHEQKSVDWKITPTTPWNYAIDLSGDWQKNTSVTVRKPGKFPFENATAPVVLKMKGKRLPHWKLESNSAGDTPQSPVQFEGRTEEIELIPYGCTRLRITEFPWTKK